MIKLKPELGGDERFITYMNFDQTEEVPVEEAYFYRLAERKDGELIYEELGIGPMHVGRDIQDKIDKMTHDKIVAKIEEDEKVWRRLNAISK